MSGLNQAQDISQTIGTTPVLLVPTEANRRFLLIQNVSTTNFVGLSLIATTPTVDGSGNGGLGTVVIAPGQGLIFDTGNNPANELQAVASASGTNVTVLQW